MKHKIIDFAYLKRFNLIMGGLHLLQGILMLIFAYTLIPNSPFAGFKPEITQNFLRFDFTLQTLVLDSRVLFQLPFAFLVACFLFISAIAHMIIVSPRFNKVYNANAFSLGRFVSDVFQGMGPVIILKEGASLSEQFFEIVERYSIPFMPVRYFLRKA